MKKPTVKITRREKTYLAAGAVVLFVGVVVFPVCKAAGAYRTEQMEQLQGELDLLESLNELVANTHAIQSENEMLHAALRNAGEMLFPPIENKVMMQTRMIALLNELGPDLDLEVEAGRSGVGDASTQMNLTVRGKGRYPEILQFLYRMETHRPLILVDSITLAAPKPSSAPSKSRTGQNKPKPSVVEKTKDPTMNFRLSIQIHADAGAEDET